MAAPLCRSVLARPLPARSLVAHLACVAAAGAAFAGAPARAAAQLPDAVGDFLPTYTGPRNPDLDVTSVRFTFDDRSTFRFFSTSAGAIGTTADAPFVWGINRGDGRANFAQLGLPDIRFDAVAVLVPGGTSFFLDLVSGVRTDLAADAVRYSGNALEGFVSLALLSPQGVGPRGYTANLWPRSALVFTDDVISDFAPDDRNVAVAVTPEPATWALFSGGLLALAAAARRRGTSARG